jgi:NIMA (never in mitosis gene a)-related kinase
MEKYQVIGEIGRGSFGKVSKIMRKSDHKILIWKELKFADISEKEKDFITNEISILKELDHPNIVKQYEIVKPPSNKKIYIVMEFCEEGDLDQLILKNKSEKKFVDENLIWDIIIQTLKALKYLHVDKKVLHRDIKPSNMFLDKDYNIKLGDFGLSRKMISFYAKTILGTPLYMSPEILEHRKYNEKSDIWSLGCSIYELASFKTPFEGSNINEIKFKTKTELPNRIDKIYSDNLWNFILKMLRYDIASRFSAEELLREYDKNLSKFVDEKKYSY